ncbi:hypothetical protein [Janthinobacterium sp. LB3P118]|uniref:hypothetical protein n=1 Tax=Janthinobacterium sp. LB3P118 TaxID=3424195 RepID=UPI003F2632E5
MRLHDYGCIRLDLGLPGQDGMQALGGLGEMVPDIAHRHVAQGGLPVTLTVKEFRILPLLLEYGGRVLSRDSWKKPVQLGRRSEEQCRASAYPPPAQEAGAEIDRR